MKPVLQPAGGKSEKYILLLSSYSVWNASCVLGHTTLHFFYCINFHSNYMILECLLKHLVLCQYMQFIHKKPSWCYVIVINMHGVHILNCQCSVVWNADEWVVGTTSQ